MAKVRWGVLGAAKIGVRKVIPAMQRSNLTEVTAIASRNIEKARAAAAELGIPKTYGSYEERLADPEIDAIYNPLPNHMHVPWSTRAAEAGKHVLCEKPVSLNIEECRRLIEVRDRTGMKIGEAFMVHVHPQWLRARELAQSGALGELRVILGAFSYLLRDPQNIRNVLEWGGGALMDIGCYPIHTSRFIYAQEPQRVFGAVDRDPDMRIDRLTSAILEFPSGQCVFTCSMQMVPYQRMQIFGTEGRIDIEIPFNAPPDQPCRLFLDNGADVFGSAIREEHFEVCDQYTLQGDAFSRAIIEGTPVPVPLEDSLRNMAVIDAVFRSGQSGRWESPVV